MEWIRKNLFSTWYNSLLTLLCFGILALGLPPFIRWAVLDAHFVGNSAAACGDQGACWVFIKVRLNQFLFGFYPPSEQWRIQSMAVLAAMWITLCLWPNFPWKKGLAVGFLCGMPILCFIFFRGGIWGLTPVSTSQWGGLHLTLVIAATGITLSLPLGILLALGRRSSLPVLRLMCTLFIELWRGVPLISVLFMASVLLPLFLPDNVTLDKLVRALIGISLFSSAYMAEVVRGGLQAIPKGQYEAAQALGLGYWKMFILVILPQALHLVIPGIVNTFIGLFKDTTLVLIIGLFDFLGMIQAANMDPEWLKYNTEGYVFAAFGFWIFCFSMSRYSLYLERRGSKT